MKRLSLLFLITATSFANPGPLGAVDGAITKAEQTQQRLEQDRKAQARQKELTRKDIAEALETLKNDAIDARVRLLNLDDELRTKIQREMADNLISILGQLAPEILESYRIGAPVHADNPIERNQLFEEALVILATVPAHPAEIRIFREFASRMKLAALGGAVATAAAVAAGVTHNEFIFLSCFSSLGITLGATIDGFKKLTNQSAPRLSASKPEFWEPFWQKIRSWGFSVPKGQREQHDWLTQLLARAYDRDMGVRVADLFQRVAAVEQCQNEMLPDPETAGEAPKKTHR